MTYEEVHKRGYDCLDDMCGLDRSNDCEVCKIAFRRGYNMAMASRDKYGWHDLRKNPDDLPEDEDKRLVITEAKNGKRNYILAYYCHDLHEWASGMNRNVIAWKYIEPFEEENNGN